MVPDRLAAAPVGLVDPDDLAVAAGPLAEYEEMVRRQLELLGEDPSRDGLHKTPSRVAKAMAWLTHGYQLDPRAVIGDAGKRKRMSDASWVAGERLPRWTDTARIIADVLRKVAP